MTLRFLVRDRYITNILGFVVLWSLFFDLTRSMRSPKKSALSDELNVVATFKTGMEKSRVFSSKGEQVYDGDWWSQLFFAEHIESDSVQGDDMLFFVDECVDEEDVVDIRGKGYFVRRKGQNLPDRQASFIDWEMTRRRERDDGKTQEIVSRHSVKVYGSPHLVRMDTGKNDEQCGTWPGLCFQVFDYEEVWKEVVLKAEGPYLLGVELLAKGNILGTEVKARLFSGGLHLTAVTEGYTNQKPSHWNPWSKVKKGEAFVPLKGPNGIGEAILAVSKELAPTSTPGLFGWIKSQDNETLSKYTCMVSSITLEWKEMIKILLNINK